MSGYERASKDYVYVLKGFPTPSPAALPLYGALQSCLKAFYCMADGFIKISVGFHHSDFSRRNQLCRKKTEF
jgi:hypothetical protein